MIVLSPSRKCSLPVFAASLLAFAIHFVSGCSTPSQGTVSGKVIYNGKPVPHVRLSLHPTGGGGSEYPIGVKEDGTFRGSDVPPGEYKVTIETSTGHDPMAAALRMGRGQVSAAAVEEMKKHAGESATAPNLDSGPAQGVAIPSKYNDPQSTPLTWEVHPGSNAAKEFVLTD